MKNVRTVSTRQPHPPHNQPEILFEDNHLIALSKPAGLLSQGERTGDENLVDWLRHYLGRNYVGLIHRLDRNTSGMMIVAKRTKAAQRLTSALQNGEILRTYLAWVLGTLPTEAQWQHLILKNTETNRSRVVKTGVAGGKEAILRVKPIEYSTFQGASLTLAEFILETGRSHQIRVQSAYEGFPLLGDLKYNPSKKQPDFYRPALHSHYLEFPHPMSGEQIKLKAPLPPDLSALRLK